jgi:hypothetical protein
MKPMAAPLADPSGLSAPARDLLGCLAAFDHTGPHNPDALRRHTRLTPAALEDALHELVDHGLACLEGNRTLWLTHEGEASTHRLFAGPDPVAASEP